MRCGTIYYAMLQPWGSWEGLRAARAERAGVGGARVEAVDVGRSSHAPAVGTAERTRWPGGALGQRRGGGLARGDGGGGKRARSAADNPLAKC